MNINTTLTGPGASGEGNVGASGIVQYALISQTSTSIVVTPEIKMNDAWVAANGGTTLTAVGNNQISLPPGIPFRLAVTGVSVTAAVIAAISG